MDSNKAKIDYSFKVVFLGDSAVGKTSLLDRYCSNKYKKGYISTIGVDYQKKKVNYKNKLIELQIWDTAGQEKYRALSKLYFKNTSGIILTFDLTNERSFANIQNWIDEIRNEVNKSLPVILVGNKNDLPNPVVQFSQAQEMAVTYQMPYFETSALTGDSIDDAFLSLIEKMIEFTEENKKYLNGIETNSLDINNKINNKYDNKDSKCC